MVNDKNLQGQFPQIIFSSHSSMVNDKNLQGQFPQITSFSNSLNGSLLDGTTALSVDGATVSQTNCFLR